MTTRLPLLTVPILPNVLGSTIPDWPTLDRLEAAGAVRLWPRARSAAHRADPDHALPTQDDYQLLVTLIRSDDHYRDKTTFYTVPPAETQPVAKPVSQPQPSLSHA